MYGKVRKKEMETNRSAYKWGHGEEYGATKKMNGWKKEK